MHYKCSPLNSKWKLYLSDYLTTSEDKGILVLTLIFLFCRVCGCSCSNVSAASFWSPTSRNRISGSSLWRAGVMGRGRFISWVGKDDEIFGDRRHKLEMRRKLKFKMLKLIYRIKSFVPSYFVSRDMFFLTDLDKEWPSCFVTVIPLCLWCDVVASLCCSTIFCDSGELETALSAGAMATSVTLLLSRVRRTVSRAVSWCHAQCHTCHVTPSPTWTPAQSFTIAYSLKPMKNIKVLSQESGWPP